MRQVVYNEGVRQQSPPQEKGKRMNFSANDLSDGGYVVHLYGADPSSDTILTWDETMEKCCRICGRAPKDYSYTDEDELDGTGYLIYTYSSDRDDLTICTWCLECAIRRSRPSMVIDSHFLVFGGDDDQAKKMVEVLIRRPYSLVGHLALADYLEEHGDENPKTTARIQFHRSFLRMHKYRIGAFSVLMNEIQAHAWNTGSFHSDMFDGAEIFIPEYVDGSYHKFKKILCDQDFYSRYLDMNPAELFEY
jgi:hypothetical protein